MLEERVVVAEGPGASGCPRPCTALKAAREAKDFTSWRRRNQAYEEALLLHVKAMLASRPFIVELECFLRPVLALARRYSLSQLLLKLTAPGVPDVYQGSEHWEEHLVDPDNRRAVDFAARRSELQRARQLGHRQVLSEDDGKLAKFWLLDRVLQLRHRRPELFLGPNACYTPLKVVGQFREHVVAFARSERVVTIAPRLLGRAPEGLLATQVELPSDGAWLELFSERTWQGPKLDCAELLAEFPVALLGRGCSGES